MNAKTIIITAIALLIFSANALAQEQIKDLFQKIIDNKGIPHISEESTSGTDSFGIAKESEVVTVVVEKPFFSELDKLEKAFENESKHASMTFMSIRKTSSKSETVTLDKPSLVWSKGEDVSPNKRFSIWRDGAAPILLGNIENSSYIIANFDDKNYPNYRTCYATEWSDINDSDSRKVTLIRVYGRKPSQSIFNTLDTFQTSGLQLRDDLGKHFDMRTLPDSIMSNNYFGTVTYFNNKSEDIPMNSGDMKEWMQKAMNNVKHLSNSDWHRFFGLLTQKMLDRKDKASSEDLVVSACVILDLCKNASQLDAEEREISAKRLEQVATAFKNNQYIHDLLMLGADKLWN